MSASEGKTTATELTCSATTIMRSAPRACTTHQYNEVGNEPAK